MIEVKDDSIAIDTDKLELAKKIYELGLKDGYLTGFNTGSKQNQMTLKQFLVQIFVVVAILVGFIWWLIENHTENVRVENGQQAVSEADSGCGELIKIP